VLALCYLISTIAFMSIYPVLSSFAFSSIIFLKREPKPFYLLHDCSPPAPNDGNFNLSILLGGVFGLFFIT
jgi:hypothetical protein